MPQAPNALKSMTATALTTASANAYFNGRIEADNYRGDQSMAATCRALFDSRIGPDDHIRVTYRNQYLGSGELDMEAIKSEFQNAPDGTLLIHSFSVDKTRSGTWKDRALQELQSAGFYDMPSLSGFLGQKGIQIVACCNRPSIKGVKRTPADSSKAIVLIEGMNLQRWYALEVCLSLLLSKWFQDKPLTEQERSGLVMALDQKKIDVYQSIISDYAEKLDLRGGAIRQKLDGFETRFAKERVQKIQMEVEETEAKVADLSMKIGQLLSKKEDALAMLHGFRQSAQKTDPITMNYFLSNRNLILVDATDSMLDFFDYTWFTNWNPDAVSSIVRGDQMEEWLGHCEEFDVSKEDAKMLYRALFLDESVRVRLWSHFQLYFREAEPCRVMGNDACPPEIQNALPNPHHQYNRCIGGNRQPINEAVIDRDFVGAIAQCESATGGINVLEFASFRHFTKDLFDPKFGKVVYVVEADQFMTTKDAIAYLKEYEQKKKEA